MIEAFTYHVKKFETNIRAKVKSNFVDETPEEQQKIGKLLLLYVDAGFTDKSLYTDICKRAFQIMPEATILSLGQSLISKPQQKKEFKWKQIDLNQYRYKKNLRPIFMKLNFASESADNPWLKSALWLQKIFINNDKLSDQLYSQCPNNIIPKHLHSYLLDNSTDNDKKIIANRYEYWLYSQISKQINNSQIYINNSNNYRSFNHKLASDKEKEQVLQTLNIPWFATSIENQLEILKKELDALWRLFNQGLKNNKFKHLSYDKKNQKLLYTKPKSDHHKKLQKKFFKQFPFCNINNVFKFVDADCGFLSALTPLQPRYAKKETYNKDKLIAAILALAFNYGNYKMSEISDLSYQELETANQQHLRLETLKKANDILSNAIAKLKIFPYYSLDFDLLYSSVDGQKFELNTPNLKARYSRKYLREGEGVSAYTILANHVPLECEIIGTHEHESYFLFDVWYNNTSDISPDIITGDMHVINKANFAIMKCFGAQVNPRFTDFNRQLKHLYCTSSLSKYKNFLIKPVAQIEHNIIIKQKSNIDQIIATLAMKKTSQANLIKKLCHLPATNDLKKAIFEYDKLVRSTYTLKYMMDSKLQKTVNKSQNRIESYHQLRAAISKVGGKKQLYGKTDIDVEISNQCNRLVCNTIIYYNSIILSRVLEKYDTQNNKKKLLSIIKRISPISWHHHIHFSGQYTFQGNDSTIDIDEFLKNFNLDL